MRPPQWSRFLRTAPLTLGSLGLKFWLSLPLLGLCFWGASRIMMQQMLSHPNPTVLDLQVNQRREMPSERVLSIKVEVDRDQGVSQVKIKTATNVVQEQEFEVASAEPRQVKAAIGQKLGLSSEQVRQLVRYQIKQ